MNSLISVDGQNYFNFCSFVVLKKIHVNEKYKFSKANLHS